jgi:NAD(P)-dependent dehydrogenase (short-subunit alcohol dehydrogenase family)
MKKIAGLVTGAGGFLGLEHCKSILDLNQILVMLDINFSKLNKNYKLLRSIYSHGIILKFKCDITNEKSVKNIKKKLSNYFVRTVINNAAIDPKPKNIKNNKANLLLGWDQELSVGLKAPYIIIECFKDSMIKNKDGCIINIASDLSIIAPNQEIYKGVYKNFTKPLSYSVIKHGIIGLTKYYAVELAKFNITCNAISPAGVYNNHEKKFISNIKKLIPMNRMANKHDIKNTIDFLINKKQKFITGQNIVIDGGRTIL